MPFLIENIDCDWHKLDSTIVDVGGGIGSLEMAYLKAYPTSNLEFIIFDIPETSENAKRVRALTSSKLVRTP